MHPKDSLAFLIGGGEIARRIREMDWSGMAIGPPESWPDALKATVAQVLNSRFPQAIAWGAELTAIYNDAFVPILGRKPFALGQPFNQTWREVWDVVGPISDAAFRGEATFIENFPALLERNGTPEQAFFTFCFSPIRDEHGQVVGMLDTVIETTATIRTIEHRRRLAFLDELSREVHTATDAYTILAITGRLVVEHLDVSNCAYADVDPDEDGFTIRGDGAAPGAPSTARHYRLSDFGQFAVEKLRQGLPLIVDDVLAELAPEAAADYQSVGIAATICVPLIKQGRLTALMSIYNDTPRIWADYDLALMAEVADRSWAHIERVRSEAHLRASAAALADLNATLEQRVEERTAQLLEAEEALRQSQKMEAVGQLTGGLAHDFNNLLGGIGGSIEMIRMRLTQGRMADLDRYLAAAQGAVERAAALTHRLLAFSRRQTLDPRPTDVNRLIADMEDLVRRTVGPSISIERIAAANLWPTFIDPHQLENAVLNLCLNARDAMPEGGTLVIATANEVLDRMAATSLELDKGDYIALSVSDSGVGMGPDVIEKAFDPFFTTKPIGQGTGLGLSMVYGFIRQSRGQVRIDSREGHGATVRCYLPRYGAAADEPKPPPNFIAAELIGKGRMVLVVDDEPTIRMLIGEVLTESGFSVIEASDGPSSLEVLRSNATIDLLITDVGLPGTINGRQVADMARMGRSDLPVIFVTGYAEQAVIGENMLEPGMMVMTKPFHIETLNAKVREAIGDRLAVNK